MTLLPEPDSPTIASVSPAATSNDTESTARTVPRSVRKRVDRLRTLRRGAVMGWGRAPGKDITGPSTS